MTGVRTKIIVDCDPGHDDAVALLFAARHFDLLAVTTVFGNASVENTTRNALAILELAGIDAPVCPRLFRAPDRPGRPHSRDARQDGPGRGRYPGADALRYRDPRGRPHHRACRAASWGAGGGRYRPKHQPRTGVETRATVAVVAA